MNLSDNVMWPGWETVRLIGRGGFGAVYEIQRTIFSDTEQAALKVISIPQNESDIDELYGEGYDSETVTSTFQAYLQSIVAEYSLMRKLNGSAHIVSCDDVRYVQHDDGIGWDIFIKMELLTALPKALPAQITEETVLKIARDMCAALELCNEYKIIHRDIKPQNIFVSKHGDYKLGDFGIAKTVEKTMGGTKIGTYKYMAPEVYNNQPYGATADIYSLGLVLYWLLNEKRMPFLPLPPEKLRVGMEEDARNRRLAGEKLPEPAHGSPWLKRIVMKACAYDPKDRYQTAREMRQDLMAEGRTAASTFAAPSVADQDEPTALLDERTVLLPTALLAEETAEEPTALLVEEPVKPQPAYQPKPDAPQTVFCMKCGARNSANKCYCSNCNAPLDDAPVMTVPAYQPKPDAPQTVFCMKCGARNNANKCYCSNCNAPLDDTPVVTVPTTEMGSQKETASKDTAAEPAPYKFPLIPLILVGIAALYSFINLVSTNNSFSAIILGLLSFIPYVLMALGLIRCKKEKNTLFGVGFLVSAAMHLLFLIIYFANGVLGGLGGLLQLLASVCTTMIGIYYLTGKVKALKSIGAILMLLIGFISFMNYPNMRTLLSFLFGWVCLQVGVLLYDPYKNKK